MAEFLPIELVFNPHWWHRTAGISFDRDFYLDPRTRIHNDQVMRRVLFERFGALGPGESDPQPRPVVGSMHVAGGFVVPALLGAEIQFSASAAPQALQKKPGPGDYERLRWLDFHSAWPMAELIEQMDSLEQEFGYLLGDCDLDGLLNTAYTFFGQDLFSSFYDNPFALTHFLEMLAGRMVEVAEYIRRRTGSCAIATNRMVAHFAQAMFLHSNCSVEMISPDSYRQFLLPVEKWMAERIQPYGIHHCGSHMQRYAAAYAQSGAVFYDVGWGSEVALCRQALPQAFFNLRLSPVRMLQCSPPEIAADTEGLLLAAGPLDKAGVCCINMDYGTPDENIFAMFEVVQRYRRYGA